MTCTIVSESLAVATLAQTNRQTSLQGGEYKNKNGHLIIRGGRMRGRMQYVNKSSAKALWTTLFSVWAISVSPVTFSQSVVSATSNESASSPTSMQRILNNTHAGFNYRESADGYWTGYKDATGKTQGNCTVFARLIHDALSAQDFMPRFVNVELRFPAPGQDARHVVTVVADATGRDWVFDNRYTGLYSADRLPDLYQRDTHVRFSGIQRRSWSQTVATLRDQNKP